jgi:PAS domain S-box-containing protein
MDNARILIVDDDIHRLHATSRVVKDAGYEALEARNGIDGLRLAAEHKPDLILLAVVLPDIDGREVCKRIKSDPETANICVVLLSSIHIKSDSQAEGLEQGADAYVARPIPNRELLARVKAMLRLKYAESRLRESERRFRAMFERHSAVMLLIEPEGGKIVDANHAAERFYGYSIPQLRSMNVGDINILPPSEVEALRLLALKEQCKYAIFPHRLANGEIKTVEVHSSPIELNGNKILFSIIHDITERKRAEESLRESEQKYRMLADNTLDVIWQLDPQLRFTYVNQASVRLIGYTPDELIGSKLEELCDEENFIKMTRVISAEISKGARSSGATIEAAILNKKKEPVPVEIIGKVIYGENGSPMAMQGVTRDITDRKHSEELLQQSLDKFTKVFQYGPALITLSDLDGTYVEVNDKFCDVSGFSREDCIGKRAVDFGWISPAERKRLFQELQTHGRVRELDLHLLTKEKRQLHCIYSGELIQTKDRMLLLSIAHDITDRKRYEQELLRIRAAVDGASDAIGMATPEGEHFYQNRTFNDLFGYTVDDLKGSQGVFKAHKNHDAAQVMFEKIKRGERWSGEIEMVAKDGRCFPVHLRANAIRDAQGSITCLMGIHTDVTELRAVEHTLSQRDAALLESETRFKTLFESARDAIFIKDRGLRYTDVNTVMVKFLDIPLSDIIGKTDQDLFGENIAAQTQNIESRVMSGQIVETQESLLYKSQPISIDCVRFPLRDSSQEIIGVCGIVREMLYRPHTPFGIPSPGEDHLSPAMRSTLSAAIAAAESNSIILLTGESGSGKDHLARYIHDHSTRCRGPFYAINCAAIPSELAESELFGHEAGAFTGSVRRKRGLIELAEGGTLLLNEIGELSYPLQGKLLQFLDTFSFTRLGGETNVTANVRLITATNNNLSSEVSEGRFRKDLYYRLDVFSIHVPSLRERNEDIPALVKEILSKLAANMALQETPAVSFDALRLLSLYSWPGNVRELRNVLERSIILSGGKTIGVQHLVGMSETKGADSLLDHVKPLHRSLHDILGETERALIQEALKRSGGKKSEAARTLGISPFALARHMDKLGIRER